MLCCVVLFCFAFFVLLCFVLVCFVLVCFVLFVLVCLLVGEGRYSFVSQDLDEAPSRSRGSPGTALEAIRGKLRCG